MSYEADNMFTFCIISIIFSASHTASGASIGNITVNEGDDVEFRWIYSASVDRIEWYKGTITDKLLMKWELGKVIKYISNIEYIDETNSVGMILRGVTQEESGLYTVTVLATDGIRVQLDAYLEVNPTTTIVSNVVTTVVTSLSHSTLETGNTSPHHRPMSTVSTESDTVSASKDTFDVTVSNNLSYDNTNTELLGWHIVIIVIGVVVSMMLCVIIIVRYFHTKDNLYPGASNTSKHSHGMVDKEYLSFYKNSNASQSSIQQHNVSKVVIHRYHGFVSPAEYPFVEHQHPGFNKPLATYVRHSPRGIVVRYTGTSFNPAYEPYRDY